jgi:hypothetical protein
MEEDITNKSLQEHSLFRAEEIGKTLQPKSVLVGGLHLSKFDMQRTEKRSVWYCRAWQMESPPVGLPADSSQSIPCSLTFDGHILEAEAHSFCYIQSRPPKAAFLMFHVCHENLPKGAD